MKNKIFKLFLILILLISFVGCSKSEETVEEQPKEPVVEENNKEALLWEVKSDTATIYLAGSIHVADEDTYPLQKKLLDAFDSADAIAVEVDVIAMQENKELMTSLSSMMLYLDGSNLTDYISEETLNLFNEYVEIYGISGLKSDQIEMLYLYKPWVLESLISNDLMKEAGFDSDLGIDMYFLKQAKEKGMEIIEVESAMSQYLMFDGFSKGVQEMLLRSALETDREEGIEEIKGLLNIWENGHIEDLEEYIKTETSGLTKEELLLYEEYNKAMIIDRNIVMTNKVEELLKGDKDIFYMVGSAHMVGEEGIIKLLQERGYTVTKK